MLAPSTSQVVIRFMICAVTQPTIHIQIPSSAIAFVQVGMMHSENVTAFQIGKSTVIAPVKSFRSPDVRNFIPNERIAVLIAFPLTIPTKQRMRWVIVQKHCHDRENSLDVQAVSRSKFKSVRDGFCRRGTPFQNSTFPSSATGFGIPYSSKTTPKISSSVNGGSHGFDFASSRRVLKTSSNDLPRPC